MSKNIILTQNVLSWAISQKKNLDCTTISRWDIFVYFSFFFFPSRYLVKYDTTSRHNTDSPVSPIYIYLACVDVKANGVLFKTFIEWTILRDWLITTDEFSTESSPFFQKMGSSFSGSIMTKNWLQFIDQPNWPSTN